MYSHLCVFLQWDCQHLPRHIVMWTLTRVACSNTVIRSLCFTSIEDEDTNNNNNIDNENKSHVHGAGCGQ